MDRAEFVRRSVTSSRPARGSPRRPGRARPFAAVESLHEAMVSVVLLAPRERRLALLRAHPDLAGHDALSAGCAHMQDAAGSARALGVRPGGAARPQRRLPRALRLSLRHLRA